ncbi:MAG: AI-2E family transporter [Mangrovibacterium sp.]
MEANSDQKDINPVSPAFNKTSNVVLLAALVIVIAGMMAAKAVILPMILALFVSIICMKPIFWLEKKGVPYGLSILITLLFICLIFISLGGVIGTSFSQFVNDLPIYQAQLDAKLSTMLGGLERFDAGINTEELLAKIDPDKLLSLTTSALSEVGGFLSDFFLILLITIFILLEAKIFATKGRLLNHNKYIKASSINKISDEIRNYLFIKTIISIVTGVFIWLWLLLSGVDYPVLWGVVAFMMNYIPNIGSIIAAIPAVALALVQLGWMGALWTGTGYLLVNMIMGNFIEPRVMGKGLGLSTLVVFLSLIVWGFIFGSIGMFLSVPLTIVVKIMLESNESTRWIAIMLGTEEESLEELGESPKDKFQAFKEKGFAVIGSARKSSNSENIDDTEEPDDCI